MADTAIDREAQLRAAIKPERGANETQEDYRARRAAANKVIKMRLKAGNSWHYEMKVLADRGVPYVKGDQ